MNNGRFQINMKINPNLLVCRTGYVIFVIKVGFLKENNDRGDL